MLQTGRLRVLVGKGRHPHGEASELADQPDQLIGMIETVRVMNPAPSDVPRRVTTQGKDVAHSRRSVLTDDATQLGHRRANARQVRQRQQRRLSGDPLGHPYGAVLRGTPGAVRDRHKSGPDALELADRLPQIRLSPIVLGREELETERRFAARHPGRNRYRHR